MMSQFKKYLVGRQVSSQSPRLVLSQHLSSLLRKANEKHVSLWEPPVADSAAAFPVPLWPQLKSCLEVWPWIFNTQTQILKICCNILAEFNALWMICVCGCACPKEIETRVVPLDLKGCCPAGSASESRLLRRAACSPELPDVPCPLGDSSVVFPTLARVAGAPDADCSLQGDRKNLR